MDAVQTLFADLRSPDLSIRFSVLLRIEDLEWTPEQVQTLRELFSAETDPGTRFHLQKILTRVGSGPEKKAGAEVAVELTSLLRKPQRDDLGLAILLEQVTRKEAPLIATKLRHAQWHTFSAEVLPFVISFFRRHGSGEDVPFLEKLCSHENPRVVAAAVEALEKLNSESLKPLIVTLLLHPSHGIRSRAIRLLYRWDPREAIRHLEATLFSDEAQERSAGLFHAFFFPFNEIEPLLRRFLSIEDNAELLQRAGLLFRANPLPEELGRLMEVMESCRGNKRAIIGELIKGVAVSLHQAGLVDRKPEKLLQELQEGYRKRKTQELLERCRLALSGTDPEIRRKAVEKLGDLARLGLSQAGELLRLHAASETDESLRSQVTRVLGPETLLPESEPVPPTTPEPAAPPAVAAVKPIDAAPQPVLPPIAPAKPEPSPPPPQEVKIDVSLLQEKLEHKPPVETAKIESPVPPKPESEPVSRPITAAKTEASSPPPPADKILAQIERLRPQLPSMLAKWKGQEKIQLIKSLARLGRREDAQLLQPCLSDADSACLAATIEALSLLDPDVLFPYLPKLIQHAADEVRVVAIRAFSLFDKRQALALVEKMLNAVQPRQRNLAIFCAAELDFPSVQQLLLKAIQREQDPDNIKQICAIFHNNPDEELYAQLIELSSELDEPKRNTLKRLASEMADQVVRAGETSFKSASDLEAHVRKRLKEEKEKRDRAQPSYSLQNIQKIRKQQASSCQGSFSDPGLVRFAASAFSVGAVATLLLWFFVIGPLAEEPTRIVIKRSTGKDANKTLDVKGQVTGVAAGGLALYLQVEGESTPFYVQFRGGSPKVFKTGDLFQGQIRLMKTDGQPKVGEVVFSY